MALMFNKPLTSGFRAIDFKLPDALSGQMKSLNDIKGEKATLLMIICNHCPYVKHIAGGIAQLAKDYAGKGIGIAAINPNDAKRYPEDSFDKMKEFAHQHGFVFPYLYDESQKTASAYEAVCTPEFYLFDSNLVIAYHGQFDGSRPGNDEKVTGNSLRKAIDNLLAELPPLENQLPSTGCSIKWKED